MNLTLIKQIEDAKEVLSELNKQLEERSAKIELQKHQDAFADFTDHFRKGGFDVSDDDAAKFRGAQHRALVAKYKTISYQLGTKALDGTKTIFLTLANPTAKLNNGEHELDIHLRPQNMQAIFNPPVHGIPDELQKVKSDIDNARKLLSEQPAPLCFSIKVLNRTPQAPQVPANHRLPQKPPVKFELKQYATLKELLADQCPF